MLIQLQPLQILRWGNRRRSRPFTIATTVKTPAAASTSGTDTRAKEHGKPNGGVKVLVGIRSRRYSRNRHPQLPALERLGNGHEHLDGLFYRSRVEQDALAKQTTRVVPGHCIRVAVCQETLPERGPWSLAVHLPTGGAIATLILTGGVDIPPVSEKHRLVK